MHWLAEVEGKKAGTVESYLVGIVKMHKLMGQDWSGLRTDRIKACIKGLKNQEKFGPREESGRRPVTDEIMRYLKQVLKDWEASAHRKLMIWSACTMLYHGLCRGGEILAKCEATVDPARDLTWGDVDVSSDSRGGTIVVTLKDPKAGGQTVVDVLGTETHSCPVRAFEKWQRAETAETNMPVYREEDGTPLTVRKLNSYLQELLGKSGITTHSLRIGMASKLGSIGASEEQIKSAGRWSSRAYLRYLRLPRTHRLEIAQKMGSEPIGGQRRGSGEGSN